jgi:succinyl-CoA synthetase beta subunit
LRLLEYEARAIFSHYGIQVPRGRVASTLAGTPRVAELLHKPVVVKAQVAVAGRGRAGGIKFAATPEEAEAAAASLIGRELKVSRLGVSSLKSSLKLQKNCFSGLSSIGLLKVM